MLDPLNLINEVGDIRLSFKDELNKQSHKQIELFIEQLNKKGQSNDYYKINRNATKMAEDQFLGKKAECFVKYYLTKVRGFPEVKVDFEIRTGSQKGWRVDFPFNTEDKRFPNVHVKACQHNQYEYVGDYSWTFQWANKNGPGGKDGIFDGPKTDLVVLVYLENPRSSKAIIKAILQWGEIEKYLKDPIKEDLKGLKKCIYFEDLKGVCE